MDDAARNLSPLTMDTPTLDLYAKVLIGVGGTLVTAGGIAIIIVKGPAILTWLRGSSMSDAERQQAENAASLARIQAEHAERTSAKTPLLSNAKPVTGGRRTRRRHRKNHSRK